MGWLGRKRKPSEEKVEELPHEPQKPLTPVLNVLVPDIAGATSFHLCQFYSTEEARDYIQTLPPPPGLHAFWGLHQPPAGHVSGEGTSEAMVLIRSAEDSDTVYVVSFVDLDSANAFARFEAKRGMSLDLLLIYWAEIVDIEVGESGVRLTPEAPPPPARRAAAEPFAEPAPAAPSPVAQIHAALPKADPVTEAEPEMVIPQPEPVAEAGPEVAIPEPEPVAEAEPELAAPEPVAAAEAEPYVAIPKPESVAEAEPEVAISEPEPVAEAGPYVAIPEPEPVAEAEPYVAIPEPEPVVDAEPEAATREPRQVFQVRLRMARAEPEPVVEQDVRPEPEPVAREEAEPVAEAPPPLFAAEAGAGALSEEEIDIEREAIAFLRASANGAKPAPETDAPAPPETVPAEALPVEAVEVVHEEPAAVGNWASAETMAPRTEGFADVAGPVRGWDSTAVSHEPEGEGEGSEDRVQEVEKILKVKRWDKKDSPFRGFDSPPGRF